MKKKIAIVACVALVVIGCVFLAGCTQQTTSTIPAMNVSLDDLTKTSSNTETTSVPATTLTPGESTTTTATETSAVTPAVTISLGNIQKYGSTFNVGDIVELKLPANETTGYTWTVTTQDKGLTVKQDYQEDEHEEGMDGVGGTTIFLLSAEKPGTYNFTAKYYRPWEDESTAIATYSDKLVVEEKKDAESVDGPVLSVVFDSFNINPNAGETVLVKIRGNATTGFRWSASGNGLTVTDDYKVDDAPKGMTGVPGTFLFYVTAPKAGNYTLKITEGKAGNDNPLTTIEIPLTFL